MAARTQPPVDAGAELNGNLSTFSAFDVLQFLTYLRRTGALWFLNEEGAEARCRLLEGVVVDAQCGPLRGEEAVLALLWWRHGAFSFTEGERHGGLGLAVQAGAMMMEAVRLADELDRRIGSLPAAEWPLSLRPEAAEVPDTVECGLATIRRLIAERPGILRAELERDSGLCPVKVRLALALLEDGRELAGGQPLAGLAGGSAALASVSPASEAALGASPLSSWWLPLIERFPGGCRLLVTLPSETPTDSYAEAVEQVGAALGVADTPVAISPIGPSFVRFRPPTGGLLSMTFLPICRKNRFLFETFVDSVDAVLLCGWSEAGAEAEIWTGVVPQRVDLEVLDEARELDQELMAALRRLSGLSGRAA